jgi:hypothetical protein
VIDQTEANPIQPPCPPQQVLIDSFVDEEIDHRLKIETKDFELNDMTEGVNPSGRRPKVRRLPASISRLRNSPCFRSKRQSLAPVSR